MLRRGPKKYVCPNCHGEHVGEATTCTHCGYGFGTTADKAWAVWDGGQPVAKVRSRPGTGRQQNQHGFAKLVAFLRVAAGVVAGAAGFYTPVIVSGAFFALAIGLAVLGVVALLWAILDELAGIGVAVRRE